MEKKILYFGLFDENFGCNKVYISALKQKGYEIIFCVDRTPGPLKFWKLFWKHWSLRKSYDVLVVGYPGYIIVPFARLITRKPIIFDALCSFYEAQILSRNAYTTIPFRKKIVWCIDWLANRCADAVLVETPVQKEYFHSLFGVPHKKIFVVPIGVDESILQYRTGKNSDRFTVLFRGRFMSEAGVKYIVEAASILAKTPIRFLIIGSGKGKIAEEVLSLIQKYNLPNLVLIDRFLSWEDLLGHMSSADVSLGQFESHERLLRTIPHKAYESFMLGLPYITADMPGIRSLVPKETCVFVPPASPSAIANAIETLYKDAGMRENISRHEKDLYQKEFSGEKIGTLLSSVINNIRL